MLRRKTEQAPALRRNPQVMAKGCLRAQANPEAQAALPATTCLDLARQQPKWRRRIVRARRASRQKWALRAGRPEFEVVCICQKPAELLRAASEHKPDVLLCCLHTGMDLNLAGLRFASPRSVVVVYSRDISPDFAHQALETGVRGFLSSTVTPDALGECLLAAARGELWMEKSLSMLLLDMRPVRLSKRQSEIVQLLSQGLKNKEIAEALHIAEGTVKAYLTVLFEKVGAKDRFELALFGLKYLKNIPNESRLPALRVRREVRSFVAASGGQRTVA